MEAAVLGFPDPDGHFILDTDASAYSMGAVLSQIQHGEEKVVAYYSHAMSRSERQYCVTRKELLAVVRSVQHFHPYLYGRHFTIRTDHAALRWLLSFRNPEGQIARWFERLQQYDLRYNTELEPSMGMRMPSPGVHAHPTADTVTGLKTKSRQFKW